jgi:hypothetical protein
MDSVVEGPNKAIRGGELESIKIPRGNSAYILKSIRCPSLLTRSRPQSYKKAIDPQNRVRDRGSTAEDNNRCNLRHVRDYGDKN